MPKRGLFISIEGSEGAGKTTQTKRLVSLLKKRGYPVVSMREPGGTKIGEAIRAITHDTKNLNLDFRAEALLFAAARAQLVTEEYKPSLDRGKVIVSDRYIDSSLVYQGIGRGLTIETIASINDFAGQSLYPDVTFLLDIPYREGLGRRLNTTKIDRMDKQSLDFYRKVGQGYQLLAKKFPERIIKIDASKDIDTIHQVIIEYLDMHWLGTQHQVPSARKKD